MMSTDKWSPNAEGRNEVILCQIGTTPAVKCSRCVSMCVCVCLRDREREFCNLQGPNVTTNILKPEKTAHGLSCASEKMNRCLWFDVF